MRSGLESRGQVERGATCRVCGKEEETAAHVKLWAQVDPVRLAGGPAAREVYGWSTCGRGMLKFRNMPRGCDKVIFITPLLTTK